MKINDSISLNQDLYINASRTLANPSSYGTEDKNSAYSININPQLSTRAVNTYENEIKNTNQAMAANQTTTNAMEKQSEILNNIKEKLQKSTELTNSEDKQNLLKDIQTKLKRFR